MFWILFNWCLTTVFKIFKNIVQIILGLLKYACASYDNIGIEGACNILLLSTKLIYICILLYLTFNNIMDQS